MDKQGNKNMNEIVPDSYKSCDDNRMGANGKEVIVELGPKQ